MKLRYLAVVVLALFLPFFATSCADDSTGDMSESEISDQLQEGGLSKEQADCLAGTMKDADLTDDDLDEYIENPMGDGKAAKAINSKLAECMGIGTGS